jgi:hypothetical protein
VWTGRGVYDRIKQKFRITMSRNDPQTQYKTYKTFRTTISDESLIEEIDEFQSKNDLSNGEFLEMAMINLVFEIERPRG